MRLRAAASAGRPVRDLPTAARWPLLGLGFVCLATAVAGGLVRLGAPAPASPGGIAWHGTLLAAGFFGTLISLERAVAIGRLWAYAAPAAHAAGGIMLLLGLPAAASALLVAGAALFALASLHIYRKQRALHTGVLAAGALCLLGANLWLASAVLVRAVPLWIAFFVLTIGGERLELSRLIPVPRPARFVFAIVALLAAASAALGSTPLLATSLAAVTLWLTRYDVATRTVRTPGVTRYIAICLLLGYAWLAIGSLLMWFEGPRDATLHAIFVGFVFSMVFGHAPVIAPAVLRVSLPYRPVFYLPLAVLHASLALRVAGDVAQHAGLRLAGGTGNALAIALFIATAAIVGLRARRR